MGRRRGSNRLQLSGIQFVELFDDVEYWVKDMTFEGNDVQIDLVVEEPQ